MSETLIIVGVRTLGREIALHFAKQGWRVVCGSRTRADVDALAADVDAAGGHGVPVVCDLGDRPSLTALVEHEATQGRIDLCVAAQTAGGRFGSRELLAIDDEELDRNYAAFVRGTWNLLKAVGPRFAAQRSGTFL